MMRLYSVLFATTSLVLATPALAGEEVLYQETPNWVSVSEIDPAKIKDGPPELVSDYQHRIEDGVVYSYNDRAIRIDNPQALMNQGTLKLEWLPDKGDLTIHKLQIIRGDETIDLVADGNKFEVLRRERGLERRLLDGVLTATMAVPGLQVGDILRVAHSVGVDDQALGDEVQVTQFIPSEPWQVAQGKTIVSWPKDEPMLWEAGPQIELANPEERDGYKYLGIEFPVEKAEDMPYDAPSRFRRARFLRVGSFENWQELSRVMAPHFETAAQIDDDSALASAAAKIADQSGDPFERMVLATRLVQDDVSYLLNGLDGGNYLPQSAEETWEKRYGDCKAKSVLLLALLREMGIESETVLVASRGGDAVAEMIPLPASFDHMIVRAEIAGKTYWIDGTTTGTRATNISDVPPFFYALPLRDAGADLMPMTQRDKEHPDVVFALESDFSAGADIPGLVTSRVTVYGAGASQIRATIDQKNERRIKQLGQGMSGPFGSMQVTSVDLDYDEDASSGTVTVKGVARSPFRYEDGRMETDMRMSAMGGSFGPTRAKSEWREIPVRTNGPERVRVSYSVILPEEGKGFEFDGKPNLESNFANTTVKREFSLANGVYTGQIDLIERLGEIAPEEINTEKRASLKHSTEKLKLLAPKDVSWRWEMSEKERKKAIAPLLEAYQGAIDFAEEDDYGPLRARANFLVRVFEFEAALADFTTLLDEEPSAGLYEQRAAIHYSLGNVDEALADLQTAYDLDLDNDTAFWLARWQAYNGKAAEAEELLELLPIGENDQASFADVKATVAAIAGDPTAAHSFIAEEVERKSQDASMLNNDCWFRGVFKVQLETGVEQCTKAVERADYPANALDSRAMMHFRLGDFDAALADLDSALEINPSLAASRYLRGIILLEQGNRAGQEEIDIALRISPELAKRYAFHGIAPR